MWIWFSEIHMAPLAAAGASRRASDLVQYSHIYSLEESHTDGNCRKDFRSGLDRYYDHIIRELSAGTSRKDVYRHLLTEGSQGGQSTVFYGI